VVAAHSRFAEKENSAVTFPLNVLHVSKTVSAVLQATAQLYTGNTYVQPVHQQA
jgi:hypothetical protein